MQTDHDTPAELRWAGHGLPLAALLALQTDLRFHIAANRKPENERKDADLPKGRYSRPRLPIS